jgi:hypothetical protein
MERSTSREAEMNQAALTGMRNLWAAVSTERKVSETIPMSDGSKWVCYADGETVHVDASGQIVCSNRYMAGR